MLYLCRVKPLRHYLRGFLIAAWAGDKIAEFSFPEISFHFPLRPWFFFVSPAYAGKRACTPCCTPVCGDHPRVCGEKSASMHCLSEHTGSPPRMRGKGRLMLTFKQLYGITPAYAGKSKNAQGPVGSFWDHPRVCGEKKVMRGAKDKRMGSPPRMRGKESWNLPALAGFRITPAYAGKRLKRSRSTVPPVAIVPLFPSVCNKPVVSDGSPAGRDAPLFLPAENAVPASPAYNLRSL